MDKYIFGIEKDWCGVVDKENNISIDWVKGNYLSTAFREYNEPKSEDTLNKAFEELDAYLRANLKEYI